MSLQVRSWTVRFLDEDSAAQGALGGRLAEMRPDPLDAPGTHLQGGLDGAQLEGCEAQQARKIYLHIYFFDLVKKCLYQKMFPAMEKCFHKHFSEIWKNVCTKKCLQKSEDKS